MVITAGKDCFVKFWHLTSANPKPQIQTNKKAKEEKRSRESSPGNMGNPWLGADSDSESEDEIQETKPEQKTEKEQGVKIEEVQDNTPKVEAKKEEKKKEEPEESDSDDDLTGWY